MKKVLHITGTMNRGGMETMLMELLRNKTDAIHFDFLVHYNQKKGKPKGDFDKEILDSGARIYYTPTLINLGPFAYLRFLKRKFEEIHPDIVHIHMNSKSGMPAKAAKKAGVQTVITHSHANITFRGNVLYRLLANAELQWQKSMINRYSDYFWGCSPEACESLFKKSRRSEFRIIPNAINTESFLKISAKEVSEYKEKLGLKSDRLIFGNAGRIVPHKNVGFIINVLEKYSKENPDFYFLFVGRDSDKFYLKEILNKAETSGLEKKVLYLGLSENIPLFMNLLDVFISPALKEGFGMTAVEAQAAGVPCLLYKGFPKTVDMGLSLTSFLENFDIHLWVEKLETIIQKKRPDKGEILHKIRQRGFDSQTNSKNICNLYLSYN